MIPYEKLDQILQRHEYPRGAAERGRGGGRAAGAVARVCRAEAGGRGDPRAIAGCCASAEETERLRADPEMTDLAEEELARIRAALPEAERAVQLALLPQGRGGRALGDPGDPGRAPAARRRRCSRRISARMYQRLAEARGWRWEVVEASPTELGGYRELVAEISGKGVFAALKFESGVHRVQRVPATEASGRIHTSAATVAVLPEAEEVDIDDAGAGHPHRHHARVGRRRAAREHHRLRRCGSRTCRPGSW